METVREEKARLRAWARRMRKAQSSELLLRESSMICERLLELPELKRARTVFCYVSCRSEVETHRLIERLLGQGKTVLVPRCREKGEMDCVPIDSLRQLVPGAYGILEPPEGLPALPSEAVELALIPALACGEDGSRLGQGGGYYDRFLERSDCVAVALCQERFLLPTIPGEPHDRKMTMIVTPRRMLRF